MNNLCLSVYQPSGWLISDDMRLAEPNILLDTNTKYGSLYCDVSRDLENGFQDGASSYHSYHCLWSRFPHHASQSSIIL